MNFKDYLKAKQESSYSELGQEINKKIQEMKTIELVNSIFHCCDDMMHNIANHLHGKQVEVDIMWERNERYHYLTVRRVMEVMVKQEDLESLNEYIVGYFSEDNLKELYNRTPIVFTLTPQGVESLKVALMGEKLFNEYMKEKLELELQEKPGGKRPKV